MYVDPRNSNFRTQWPPMADCIHEMPPFTSVEAQCVRTLRLSVQTKLAAADGEGAFKQHEIEGWQTVTLVVNCI